MSKVHLFNTLPRPYSIPYQITPNPDPEKAVYSTTDWLQLSPGISLDVDSEIWEIVNKHPDVKEFINQRTLIVTAAIDLGKTEQYQDVLAITSGEVVKIVDQPVPVTRAKTTSTLATPAASIAVPLSDVVIEDPTIDSKIIKK